MPEIDVKDARAGMVLAEPTVDLLGNPLQPAGTVLTDTIIRTLKAWGVARVNVESLAGTSASTQRPRKRRTTRLLRLPQDEPPPPAEAEPSPPEAPEPEPGLEARLQALDVMFAPHRGRALMQNIRKLAEHHLRRRYGTDPHG